MSMEPAHLLPSSMSPLLPSSLFRLASDLGASEASGSSSSSSGSITLSRGKVQYSIVYRKNLMTCACVC